MSGTVIALVNGDDKDKTASASSTREPASPKPGASTPVPESESVSPADADEPDGPTTVKIGRAINVDFLGSRAKVTVKSVKKAKSDNMFDKPERGQYVAVDVDIFATKGDCDLGPSNFRLIAKDGTVYQSEILVAGIQPQLDAMTTVRQGQRKTGKVVFDVDPGKVVGLKVELSDDFSDAQGYWTP